MLHIQKRVRPLLILLVITLVALVIVRPTLASTGAAPGEVEALVPQETAPTLPTAVGAPVVAHAPEQIVHSVRRGETLTAIAHQYGVTIASIIQTNGLVDANRIYVGQRLMIPQGGTKSEILAVSPPTAPSSDRVVYLTFDDGPNVQWTPLILATLARHHAQATFFVVGQQAQRSPALLKAIVSAGHHLGNHTYTHTSLVGLDHARFVNELQRTQALLGTAGTTCLRPPYGAIDGAVRQTATQLGYHIVLWDIDTRDWTRPGAPVIAAQVMQRVHPGSIVLLHDGGGPRGQTVQALETILRELSARGYQFRALC